MKPYLKFISSVNNVTIKSINLKLNFNNKCNEIKSKIDFKINNFIKAYKYIDSDLLTNKQSSLFSSKLSISVLIKNVGVVNFIVKICSANTTE